MKFTVKKQAKLTLDKQTVRQLAQAELNEIAGGRQSADIQSCPNPRWFPSFCQ